MGSVRSAPAPSPARRVVVVDDDAEVLQGVNDLLQHAVPGSTVSAFLDPNQALAFLSGQTADLLVVDFRMHPINGLDLVRMARLRQPRLPCILITADADLDLDAAWRRELHIHRAFRKPLEPLEFLGVVQEILSAGGPGAKG